VRRFMFRFEAVLKQRNAVLDQRTLELAEVERKRAMALDLLTRRRQSLATHVATSGVARGRFEPHRELIRQRYLQRLRAEIGRRELQLETIGEEHETARVAVTEAHRGVRAMELLEERDRTLWAAEVRRAEERENDEQNAQRHAPERRAPGR